ncbi:CDP-alcohol phosphatidyltransferase family protein, partial [Angustibacter aerolatus]
MSTLDPAPFAVARPGPGDELAAVRAWHADEDEQRLRLRRASRSDDGFLSTFLVRPPSRWLTRPALALGLPAAAVTGVALLLGLAAAAAYAGGGTGWRVLGSVLLLASLVVDCVDGQVARLTRTTSARGAWLDVGADRVKEYAVYAGLAAGAHDRTGWVLALAAMALLVTRHHVDFAYATLGSSDADSGVAAWSARTDLRGWTLWARRFVIMPVGERTLVLVVLAPLLGVRATLVVLLAWGLVAAAWTTAGRVGRTVLARSWPGVRPGAARQRLAA